VNTSLPNTWNTGETPSVGPPEREPHPEGLLV